MLLHLAKLEARDRRVGGIVDIFAFAQLFRLLCVSTIIMIIKKHEVKCVGNLMSAAQRALSISGKSVFGRALCALLTLNFDIIRNCTSRSYKLFVLIR